MGDNVVINIVENVTDVVVNAVENPTDVSISVAVPFDSRLIDLSKLPFSGDLVDGDKLLFYDASLGGNYYLRPSDIASYLKNEPWFPYTPVQPNDGDIIRFDESDEVWYPIDGNVLWKPTNGWIQDTVPWIRVSNTLFTRAGSVASYTQWRPGAKVRFYTPSTYKYGVIYEINYVSPNTYIQLIETSDYVIDANPTWGWVSPSIRPAYMPDELNWNPAFSYLGGTTNPTFAATTRAVYRTIGNRFMFDITALIQTGGVGDRDTTRLTIPYPMEVLNYKPVTVVVSGLIGSGDHVVPAYVDDDMLYVRHGTMTMDGAIFATGSFEF